jgi:hypothetical protein
MPQDGSVPAAASVAPSGVVAPARTRWYGYQLMAADALSVPVMLSGSRNAFPIGIFGYLVAPIAIHSAHHNVAMAIVSPLLRFALPVAGLYLGNSSNACHSYDDECGLGNVVLGGAIGLGVALLVDYAAAWDGPAGQAYSSPLPQPRPSSPGISLTAAGVAPMPNGASLVLGGIF